ncbi:MAG: hypothetical protein Q8L13_11800 [Bradyrhizobium sp.]|uniref:hypothetical protein n=1 Tax=Bradyrhizobium sp. TaxID=376 RepID=UPI002731098F|nr:hypothetical protein [Bradyrhizobium sp.]MDP1867009.1 hypothetical protein [Bradyrhizobium sp.]
MANASIVIDNNADNATVGASSQVLVMPASNLLTPHPSERWRSLSNTAWFVLDKGAAVVADTVMIGGLTCGVNATARLRLSSIDASGAAGDIFDSGDLASGSISFDVEYRSFVHQLAAPAAWRYQRFDINDPDADFVEAGSVVDGLAVTFDYNFAPGGSFQHVDRSRVSTTASGMTLIWDDNNFRRVDLSFGWVTAAQRYGLIERLDRIKGKKRNVLLITDPESENLPRDSIFGRVTDQTAVNFGPVFDIFGKQLRIEERI